MDSKKTSTKANLRKYISIDCEWCFVPVLKSEGKPRPEFVLVDGTPARSKGETFISSAGLLPSVIHLSSGSKGQRYAGRSRDSDHD